MEKRDSQPHDVGIRTVDLLHCTLDRPEVAGTGNSLLDASGRKEILDAP